jgi:hypothetical protein
MRIIQLALSACQSFQLTEHAVRETLLTNGNCLRCPALQGGDSLPQVDVKVNVKNTVEGLKGQEMAHYKLCKLLILKNADKRPHAVAASRLQRCGAHPQRVVPSLKGSGSKIAA